MPSPGNGRVLEPSSSICSSALKIGVRSNSLSDCFFFGASPMVCRNVIVEVVEGLPFLLIGIFSTVPGIVCVFVCVCVNAKKTSLFIPKTIPFRSKIFCLNHEGRNCEKERYNTHMDAWTCKVMEIKFFCGKPSSVSFAQIPFLHVLVAKRDTLAPPWSRPEGQAGHRGGVYTPSNPGAALAADFGAEGLSSERVWGEARNGPVVTLRGREPKKSKNALLSTNV